MTPRLRSPCLCNVCVFGDRLCIRVKGIKLIHFSRHLKIFFSYDLHIIILFVRSYLDIGMPPYHSHHSFLLLPPSPSSSSPSRSSLIHSSTTTTTATTLSPSPLPFVPYHPIYPSRDYVTSVFQEIGPWRLCQPVLILEGASHCVCVCVCVRVCV